MIRDKLRLELETKELRNGEVLEPLEIQQYINLEEERQGARKKIRPTVFAPSCFRFISRTMCLFEHLVSRYRFVLEEDKKADLALSFYPFRDGIRCVETGLPFVMAMRGQFWHMPKNLIDTAVGVYEHASHIITLTNSMYADLTGYWPHLATVPHKTIHNGHYADRMRGNPGKLSFRRPIILCITNYNFYGKRRAVEDMALALDKRNFHGTFLVASKDPPGGVRFPNLGRCGLHCGFVANKWALYESADLFLYPSYVDGQPTALIEALSAGMPCVASDCEHNGSSEFIVDGKTGRLFVSPDEGADIALSLLRNRDLALSYGKSGKAWVLENCDWKKSAEQYHEVFQIVLGKGKG